MQGRTLHRSGRKQSMFLFGHVGITLGVGIAVNQLARYFHTKTAKSTSQSQGSQISPVFRTDWSEGVSHLTRENDTGPLFVSGKTGTQNQVQQKKTDTSSGMTLVEMLFLVLGSLLPDIIDKPVGQFFFSGIFNNNGRIFSHTLVFLLGCLGAALYFYLIRKNTWGLYLSLGILMHLLLDSMWENPQVLFWPLYGWSFPVSREVSWWEWLKNMVSGVLSNPVTYIPEIAGLLVLAGTIAAMIRTRLIVMPGRKKSKSIH